MRLRVALALTLASTSVLAQSSDDDLAQITQPGTLWAGRGPSAVRDQNPLLAGFALPRAMPVRAVEPGEWGAQLDISWGSTALMEEVGDEALLVDAETREARLTLGGTLSERFAWQAEIPYRYTGGGNLDSFIDSWHDFFGLDEGARPILPRDQTNIVYARSGVRQLDVRSSASGLGDIKAALGYAVSDSGRSPVMAWLSVELPTGDEDKLTGNGAVDVSLQLSTVHALSHYWSVFGHVAGTWLGGSDLLPIKQNDIVYSAMAGIGVRPWQALVLKAQLDAHTAVYDSTLDFLDEAVVLTIGGDYQFDSGLWLELGVSEDLAVEHSPDVVFVFSVSIPW